MTRKAGCIISEGILRPGYQEICQSERAGRGNGKRRDGVRDQFVYKRINLYENLLFITMRLSEKEAEVF